MRSSFPHILILASTLICATAAAGDPNEIHENVARGIKPDKMYHFTELDSVNLFNGNLSLSIPIGGPHPVSERLSWGLMLAYNSKSWDSRERTEDGVTSIETLPSNRSNAGNGWLLSLGRLFSPGDIGYNHTGSWVYESPDGGDHVFYTTLHAGETAVPNVFYTADGTYLRIRGGATNYDPVFVDFPDGSVHTFTPYLDGQQWRRRLTKVADAFGNNYTIGYAASGADEIWTIEDQHGRTGIVTIGDVPNAAVVPQDLRRAVKSVLLPAFGALDAKTRYDFTYQTVPLTAPFCGEGPSYTAPVHVPQLVDVAVATEFGAVIHSFTYHASGCQTGALASMLLPTGGTVAWTYGSYSLPIRSCESPVNETPGVSSRTFTAPGAAPATWQYASATLEDGATVLVPCQDPSLKIRTRTVAHHSTVTTVTSPDGDQTQHYFAAWSGLAPHPATGHTRQDYGLPFSGIAVKSGAFPKFLSTRSCDGTCSGGSRVRETYVRYERDANRGNVQSDLNRRLAGSRTEYYFRVDGGPEQSGHDETDYADFDGVGHYRTETKTGSFLGNGGARHVTTAYNVPAADNPGAWSTGSYSAAIPSSFHVPPAGGPWMLNTYSSVVVSEEGLNAAEVPTAAREEACFDPATGFLLGTRTFAGAAMAGIDVVRVFASEGGNTTRERVYGGDRNPLQNPTLSTCTLARTAPGTPEYETRHRYAFGVRFESQAYDAGTPLELKSLDQVIDRNTGLIAESKDTAGLPTLFAYDAIRRLKETRPPGVQPIAYAYSMATAQAPATIRVTQTSAQGSGVINQEIEFDPFGRVTLEKRKMPDGTWAKRRTFYDGDGQRSAVSEWQADPQSFTQFLELDPFGRPARVVAPDGSVTRFAYEGVHITRRTSTVATSIVPNAPETDAVTTESRDVHGRLYRVAEPAGISVTDYDYDVGSRLAKVTMIGGGTEQTRLFRYDNRGFLLREKHPEKGVTGNGWVVYPCYDALGNALRRIDGVDTTAFACDSASPASLASGITDVAFEYDRAARLRFVREKGQPGRLLKQFDYGLSTSSPSCSFACDWSLGKMKTATRHNWHPQAAHIDVPVTETFTYGARGGRLSEKTTTIGLPNTTPPPSLTQKYEYGDLGEPTAIDYPSCSAGVCGVQPQRRIERQHTNGFITAVPGYTRDGVPISYWPSGVVRDVPHANGVTDTTTLAAHGMPRPASITISGYQETPSCAPPSVTASGPLSVPYGSTAALTAAASGSGTLTYRWYDTAPSGTTTPLFTGTSFTTPALTRSATFWVRVTRDCGGASSFADAQVTVAVQLASPSGLTATYQHASGFVQLTWTAAQGDVRYTVQRSADGVQFQSVVSNLAQTSYTDAGLTAWSAYLYRVLATSAVSGTADPSSPGTADAAVVTSFTNPGSLHLEWIRGAHLGELRRAADALRVLSGLPRVWNEPAYQPLLGWIQARDFVDVRDALLAARSRLTALHGAPALSLGIAQPMEIIGAPYIESLREATR